MSEGKKGSGGFFKALRSIVYEDEKPATPQPAVPHSTTEELIIPQPQKQFTQPIVPVVLAPNGEVNDKFVAHFAALLETANKPGDDYFEFRRALDNLGRANLADNAKYPAAFFALGISLDTLREGVAYYLKVLDDDSKDFQTALAEQYAAKVDVHRQEIESSEAEIAAIESKIAELQQARENAKKDIAEKAQMANDAKEKIDKRVADYQVSHKFYVQMINDDLKKVVEYVTPLNQAKQ